MTADISSASHNLNSFIFRFWHNSDLPRRLPFGRFLEAKRTSVSRCGTIRRRFRQPIGLLGVRGALAQHLDLVGAGTRGARMGQAGNIRSV